MLWVTGVTFDASPIAKAAKSVSSNAAKNPAAINNSFLCSLMMKFFGFSPRSTSNSMMSKPPIRKLNDAENAGWTSADASLINSKPKEIQVVLQKAKNVALLLWKCSFPFTAAKIPNIIKNIEIIFIMVIGSAKIKKAPIRTTTWRS